ncbi:MAG: FHA domain-containing protein [Desulfobulbaceae bacterium]|nr:FHA domain-containing protein [Desulfobulbaceae bacterium]
MEEWVVISKNRIIQRFTIKEGQCLAIGRGDEADIIINNSSVSRKHTSLELKEGFYYLSDLNSTNGTRVNGEKIYSERQILKSDNIAIGKFILKPAKLLGEEVEAGSVVAASMDLESANQTLYVTGIHKEQGKVEAAPKKRLLSVLQGGATPAKLILRGKTITAGKDPSANLVIPGALLAKTLFVIKYRPEGYVIIPKTGLFSKIILNGKKISGEKLLKPMDVIEVGKTKIRYT